MNESEEKLGGKGSRDGAMDIFKDERRWMQMVQFGGEDQIRSAQDREHLQCQVERPTARGCFY